MQVIAQVPTGIAVRVLPTGTSIAVYEIIDLFDNFNHLVIIRRSIPCCAVVPKCLAPLVVKSIRRIAAMFDGLDVFNECRNSFFGSSIAFFEFIEQGLQIFAECLLFLFIAAVPVGIYPACLTFNNLGSTI